ncbi:DUF937 domain-containing protein [Propioniciclava tarda]|uniref:DUF937 domain-containing protein n=1 Tax=Propioniciclava tarda TaxID=433330 RepID=A0A4Q9KLC5_PROTD|nr:DUF937 domain-containing protein [Propioniciclava tarda]TBT95317.1 DUF937 domain-containing protein [Propioniciclava tarda]SMO60807.1 hypothetical protein SAMN06266982_10863 [Propioniciclava tarda]
MGAISDILANLDVDQIAAALGQNPADVESAAQKAVGSLLGGLENNLGSDQGAISLANALGNHLDDDNAAPQTGAIDLSQLDLTDGAKIVNHILPATEQRQLFGGVQGALIKKLMPLLAPIVMSYLAKRLASSGGLGSILGSVLGSQSQASSGGMGDILGQILGGGTSAKQAQQQHGGLGDILGQILGGGAAAPAQQQSSGGGFGDILGQILGGGQEAPQTQTQYQQPQYQQPGNLTIDDPGADAAAASANSGMPSVGGILKSILFG